MATAEPPKPAPPGTAWRAKIQEVEDQAKTFEAAVVPLAVIGNTSRVAVVTGNNVVTVEKPTIEIMATATSASTSTAIVTEAWTAQQKAHLWRVWNDLKVQGWLSSSSTCSTTTNAVWYNWNDGLRDEYDRAIRIAWQYWNDGHELKVEQRKLTEAEQAQRRAAAERAEFERKVRVAQIEAAKDKAHKLLLSALDERQKTELRDRGYFHCKSQKGHVYRIYKGTHGNVKKIDPISKKEIESLCIQPDNVPDWDAMLAQKLHIEFNEDHFRKTANITPIYN